MTPFAKLSRQYRKDRGLLLGEVADLIGRSASFLSQVETGSKPIPDSFVGKLTVAMKLTAREASALANAAALSAKEFRITLPNDAKHQDREIARQLSAGFTRMSTAKKQRILQIMQEGTDG